MNRDETQSILTSRDWPLVWLVDGWNVIGARPDGWWRDRRGAVGRLLERLETLAALGPRVILVLDGLDDHELPAGTYGQVRLCYATRRGADAADDRIIELITHERRSIAPGSVLVTTSDKRLQSRVDALGARCQGVQALLDLLTRLEEPPSSPDS